MYFNKIFFVPLRETRLFKHPKNRSSRLSAPTMGFQSPATREKVEVRLNG